MKNSILLLLFSLLNFYNVGAAVGITAPSLNITTCTFPSSYNNLGNIVITEGANGDIWMPDDVTNYTLILTAPANFEFEAGTGSVTFQAGDITAASIAITSTTITITYQASEGNATFDNANRRDELDVMTISGIKVRAINSASSGNILRTTGTPGTGSITGITNNSTNFATLTSNVGCGCNHTLRMTDTFGDGWNGGTVSVSVNGVNVLTNVTLASGAGPSDLTFTAGTGDVIRIYETAAGSYDYEMRAQIFDGGMTSIVGTHDPVTGTVSTGGTTGNGNCPPPMSLTAANVVQNASGSIARCASNQTIVCLQVTTTGATSPITLTQIQTNVSGTIATSAISNVDIYYTGTTNSFSTTTLFGSNASPSTSTYNINGSQVLNSGTNYFWLVYDLNNTGTIGATVDGIISQFTAGGINYTSGSTPAISTTNPAGNGTLAICSAPGGVFTGLDVWVKANIGLSNQAAGGTGISASGSPSINNTAQTYNYNPYIDFTAPAATLDGGLAASRQFLSLNGYSDISGVDYRTFFFAFQLNDLTRVNTHVATVSGITYSGGPASGTLHGHAVGGQAAFHDNSYDSDYGTGAPAGTWKQNMVNATATSIHLSSKHILSASSANPTMVNTFLGGQWDQNPASGFAGHFRDWKGPVGEIIAYTTQLSATDNQKVHSYLGIKYGITMQMNYLSTSGSTIFNTSAPYNQNIIGIGRDDNQALDQRQSHQDDDTVRIYMGTLAAMNASNGTAISSDISYVVQGSDNRKLCTTASAMSEIPSGLTNCAITSRLEREWKVTRTNMSQNYNMDVKLNACGAPGSVNIAHLRLLVDDDGNFGNGGTQCYYNGDGSGIVISYSNPTITISNISTTHIPNNATRFITIASIDLTTPLPIELINYTAKLNEQNTVELNWETSSERENDYFTVYKSIDGENWAFLGKVNGNGTTNISHSYSLSDLNPNIGENYYKLSQTDFNGEIREVGIRLIELKNNTIFILSPNPTKDKVTIFGENLENYKIRLTNNLGQLIEFNSSFNSQKSIDLSLDNISSGIYYVILNDGKNEIVLKLMIQK